MKLYKSSIFHSLTSLYYNILTPIFYKFYEYFRYRKSKLDHTLAENNLKKLFFDLKVTDGPFKGLKYPRFESFGSALFPKLSGIYENELHSILNDFIKVDYDLILDIGCAEGYYAVGLALSTNNTNIYAFDVDDSARKLCYEMSKINNLTGRINVLKECTQEWLLKNCADKRGLLICDCEGDETSIFTMNTIKSLKKFNLIIETHPMFDRKILNILRNRFSYSHDLSIITSYDEKRKIFDLDTRYSFLSDLEKLKLIQEGRMFSMDWLICKSKESFS